MYAGHATFRFQVGQVRDASDRSVEVARGSRFQRDAGSPSTSAWIRVAPTNRCPSFRPGDRIAIKATRSRLETRRTVVRDLRPASPRRQVESRNVEGKEMRATPSFDASVPESHDDAMDTQTKRSTSVSGTSLARRPVVPPGGCSNAGRMEDGCFCDLGTRSGVAICRDGRSGKLGHELCNKRSPLIGVV